MRSASPAFALMTIILASGCVGGNGAAPASGSSGPAVASGPAQFDEQSGAVDGFVLDTESAPIVGATVGLVEAKVQVATDVAGHFSFSNVPAGKYQLAAAALGFGAKAMLVEVTVGQVTSAKFLLEKIELHTAYHTSFPIKGYFECSYQAGNKGPCFYPWAGTNNSIVPVDLWPNNKRQFDYGVGAGAMTVLNEMSWSQTSVATGNAMSVFMSYNKRTGNHWYCDHESGSPVYMRWDRSLDSVDDKTPGTCLEGDTQLPAAEPQTIPMAGQILTTRANTGTSNLPGLQQVGLGMAFQQSFEVMISTFYWEHAPEKWSGLSDS